MKRLPSSDQDSSSDELGNVLRKSAEKPAGQSDDRSNHERSSSTILVADPSCDVRGANLGYTIVSAGTG